MIKKQLISLFFFILLALNPVFVRAADEKLPEMLVGQTEAWQTMPDGTNKYYFGSITGNEAVLNYVPPGKTTQMNFGPSLFLNRTQETDGDGYVTLGNYGYEFSQGIAVSFWIKPDNKKSGDWILSIAPSGSNTNRFDIQVSPSGNFITISNDAKNSRFNFGQKVIGVWTHVIASIDQAGLARVFINGNLIDVEQNVKPDRISGGGYIGRPAHGSFASGANIFYGGGVDEFKVFNAPITNNEQASSLHRGIDPFSPINYWSFSEGAGTLVGDIYGNETGKISGSYNWELMDVPHFDDDERGFVPFGFDRLNLMKCVNGLILGGTPKKCYIKNSKTETVSIMTSRTYLNSLPGLEVASLFYTEEAIIIGDAYLGGRNLGDFNYWGRHLATSRGNANSDESMWGIGGYTINPDAQASLSGKEYDKYINKINVLRGEASLVTYDQVRDGNPLYLQANMVFPEPDYTVSTPEGKLWKTDKTYNDGDIKIAASKKYRGVGTIFVDGNLTIGEGDMIDLMPTENTDLIGFIVTGNVNIGANVKLKAAIFTTGEIKVGPNVEMIGSFVANSFNFPDVDRNGVPDSNTRFIYDERLSNKMPPGFGYLNMPGPN